MKGVVLMLKQVIQYASEELQGRGHVVERRTFGFPRDTTTEVEVCSACTYLTPHNVGCISIWSPGERPRG